MSTSQPQIEELEGDLEKGDFLKSWMEGGILSHFSHSKHNFGVEGNLAGFTEQL